jgi:hypothetical protein
MKQTRHAVATFFTVVCLLEVAAVMLVGRREGFGAR